MYVIRCSEAKNPNPNYLARSGRGYKWVQFLDTSVVVFDTLEEATKQGKLLASSGILPTTGVLGHTIMKGFMVVCRLVADPTPIFIS